MEQATSTFNTFFENTCVIVVFAYVLTRGRLMGLLFREQPEGREILLMGGVFGLMGLLELFFSSLRFPYDTYTLIVTFAVINAGLYVGLMTSGFIVLGSFFFLTPEAIQRTSGALFASVAIAGAIRYTAREQRHTIIAGLLAMVLAEAATIYIRLLMRGPISAPFSEWLALARIGANGFGFILLQLIVNDAQVRALSEQYRIEAERSRALQAESQLLDLRARIHPHFLFNTLTSIAGLCAIAPEKAEQNIVRLSHLMRRTMEDSARNLVALRVEMEYVRDYVEIEQLRMAHRLAVVWKIDPDSEQASVPPFSVQILVENALNHGITPRQERGTVTITTRCRRNHVVIAVQDDGIGMSPEDRQRARAVQSEDRLHALQILNQQLYLLYGPSARLRIFSKPERGALVAFKVPAAEYTSSLRQETKPAPSPTTFRLKPARFKPSRGRG